MATGDKKGSEKETGKEIKKAEPAHLLSPFEEWDRFYENIFPRHWLRSANWEWPRLGGMASPFSGKLPRVDVIDREKEVLVRAELPGVEKDKIDISMTDNSITIKGSTSHEEKEEKGEYYRSEIVRGAFTRTVPLPSEVNSDKAKAQYNDGILEITVPKEEKARRRPVKIE
jgi:HSP20 family protein